MTREENNLDCYKDGFSLDEESAVARQHWKIKRIGQGFSYEEVLNEMKRRVEGEYRFTAAESVRRLKQGVQRLNRTYRLSALILDFLDKEGMTHNDLRLLIGTHDHESTLEILLDPVSHQDKQHSLRNDYFVHCFYPGEDVPFEGVE